MNRNLIETYAAGGQKLRHAVAGLSREDSDSLGRDPAMVNSRAGHPSRRQRRNLHRPDEANAHRRQPPPSLCR